MSARKKKQAMSDAELQKFLAGLPPPTWQEIQAWRKVMRSQTKHDALTQILRAIPEGLASSDTHPAWQSAALFATFLPNDGPESALARLMVAATNTAMDCFALAKSDAPQVRDLELNYAIRLCLTAAALSKAFDHHRVSKKEDFIDDTVPIGRRLKPSTRSRRETNPVKRNPIPLPKKKIESPTPWQRISETPRRCWRVLAAERGLVPVFLAARPP